MPFTISHAAAALPVHALGKSRLPLAALMVGSMSPDFTFFLPGELGRHATHSLPGVFLFCLPAGLAVWLFYLLVLERPTIAFLPDAWRTRITPSPRLTPRALFAAALAIVLGAFTHLIWDSFTHGSTPVSEALPGFAATVFNAGGMSVRVYFLLQIFSSVFGLGVLAAWAWRIRKRPQLSRAESIPELSPAVSNFERALALVLIAAFSCAVGFYNRLRYDGLRVDAELFVLLVGGMMGAALGWTVVAIAIRFRSRSRTPVERPAARFGQRS
jgi:hypothetical protein